MSTRGNGSGFFLKAGAAPFRSLLPNSPASKMMAQTDLPHFPAPANMPGCCRPKPWLCDWQWRWASDY